MSKRVLIICASVHHKNTLKIAEIIGKEFNAKVIKPKEFELEMIAEYDLIGFGSGIYNGKHHKSVLNIIAKLKNEEHKPAFIFSTATIPVKAMHKDMKRSLIEKGFDIIGEFSCKGFMDYSFTKYLGGLNKGRPNAEDLRKAQDFAKEIKHNKY
ncbi:MAG: flavodoxin [Clostridia bacterium]|nr:flavodoxin [Clostridia bacterium]